MSLPRLAIIGTGVAGLGCAYFLRERYDLTLFERNDYAGGHTNTIDVAARYGPEAAADSFMRRIVGDAVWERLGERTRAERRAEGTALLVDLGDLRSAGRPYDPAGVGSPAVVGAGARSDPHRRRASIETLLTLAPARPVMVTIPGAGHGAHASHPDGFASLVERAVALARTAN